MLVKLTDGSEVFFTHTDGKSLFDHAGVAWARTPDRDENGCAAYTETRGNISTVLLTVADLKRVCAGNHEILKPRCVKEFRWYVTTLSPRYRAIADQWPDQKLREILSDADESHRDPTKIVMEEIEKELPPVINPRAPQTRLPVDTGKTEEPKTARSTPRPRKQEGSVSVTTEGMSVLLTPKQLEFMERLSECEGWDAAGVNGEYNASEYAQELSDTMNPMSVGAVLTTLREKHLLTTEKRKIGAVKCCMFKLTALGAAVYNKLAER